MNRKPLTLCVAAALNEPAVAAALSQGRSVRVVAEQVKDLPVDILRNFGNRAERRRWARRSK